MRPASGSVKWRRHAVSGRYQWHTRITLADGARPWVALDPAIAEDDIAGARRCSLEVSEVARRSGFVPANVKQTVEEYSAIWMASREGRVTSNFNQRGHLDNYILPLLGPLDMRAVGRVEVEGLVAKLDAKVRAGKISSDTASKIWRTAALMFDDATNAKPSTGLRCLDVDPTDKVRGPDDDGSDQAMQLLYPSELSQFMACTKVPRHWRRRVAIAVYLCLRDAEQNALAWPSVDLVHGVVTVGETYHRRTKTVDPGTKTGPARMVPIHPALLPLLHAMHAASGGKGLVCGPPKTGMARELRRILMTAGITRPELHDSTDASHRLRWHDLRATGLTWYALEGRPATEIRDIAGHTETGMTDVYMRAAGILRGGRFGQPFPALPDPSDLILVGSASVSSRDDSRRRAAGKNGSNKLFPSASVDDDVVQP